MRACIVQSPSDVLLRNLDAGHPDYVFDVVPDLVCHIDRVSFVIGVTERETGM